MNRTNECSCQKETKQEKFMRIDEIIEEYKDKEGSLIQILHLAQGIYGHLPLELEQFIAQRLDIPLSTLSGVVNFYTFFSTQPKGKYTISVCMGTACYVRGGKKIIDQFKNELNIGVGDTTADGKFTLNVMRCIGACGLAPAIKINEKVYKQVNPNKLQTILNECQDESEVQMCEQ